MKHLQKVKHVSARVFYANNGHFKGIYHFGCALDAKRFIEDLAATSKPLHVIIEDDYNTLYIGNGIKI